MYTLRSSLVLAALFVSLVSSTSMDGFLFKRQRDTTFPACDDDPNSDKLYNGVASSWKNSTDPNFYVASGRGSCGEDYTDDSNIVCLHPGWVKSANINKCNAWVEVELDGRVGQGRVLDTCGAVANSTFDCGDIYLSKQLFEQLAGDNATATVAAGRLPRQVQWRFVDEPCWGCWAGLQGNDPDGSKDSCQGSDASGYLRCGRKTGEDRVVGRNSDVVCNRGIRTCQQAEDETLRLPKYKGKDSA